MYCGSNKTALTSQKQISEAMLALLKCKSFADISVCEICKEAQISRQTFYSLFRSKENVICYELERNYCFTLHEDCCVESLTLEELSNAYAAYIESQKDFISLLVENNLMDCMRESIYETFMSCGAEDTEENEADRCFTADFIASGLTSIAKNYVLFEDSFGPEYLSRMICRLLGGEIFR